MWQAMCGQWSGWGWGWGILMPLIWIAFLVGAVYFGIHAFSAVRRSVIREGRCGACRSQVEAAYLRCPECGYQLKKNCPTCRHIVKTSWSICPYCEADLAARPEPPSPGGGVEAAHAH